METEQIFLELRHQLGKLADSHGLLAEQIVVRGKDLKVEEAIGNPQRQDFPLQKGKEKLLQANFKGMIGQAFTDHGGRFEGSLDEMINWPIESDFDRAVFIASLNAVMRYLGLIKQTVHCKDEEPEQCAAGVVTFIKQNYGDPKIALVGYQPALIEALSSNYSTRILDLDPDRIGTTVNGARVEDGQIAMTEVLDWCELIFATGSTLSNGTIGNFLNAGKEVVFFGTTIAGPAHIMGWNRYCECAK